MIQCFKITMEATFRDNRSETINITNHEPIASLGAFRDAYGQSGVRVKRSRNLINYQNSPAIFDAVGFCSILAWAIRHKNENIVKTMINSTEFESMNPNKSDQWFTKNSFLLVERIGFNRSEYTMTSHIINFGTPNIFDMFASCGQINWNDNCIINIKNCMSAYGYPEHWGFSHRLTHLQNMAVHLLDNYDTQTAGIVISADNILQGYMIGRIGIARKFAHRYLNMSPHIRGDAYFNDRHTHVDLITIADDNGDTHIVCDLIDKIGCNIRIPPNSEVPLWFQIIVRSISDALFAHLSKEFFKHPEIIRQHAQLFLRNCCIRSFLRLIKNGWNPIVLKKDLCDMVRHEGRFKFNVNSAMVKYWHLTILSRKFLTGRFYDSWMPREIKKIISTISSESKNPKSRVFRLPAECVCVIIGHLLAAEITVYHSCDKYDYDDSRCYRLVNANFDLPSDETFNAMIWS